MGNEAFEAKMWWIGLLFLGLSGVAQAQAQTDVRELLLEALRKPENVSVQAEVNGVIAERIRRDLQAPGARVVVNISTEAKLAQPGCRRLRMRFTTPGTMMPTKDGGPSAPLDMSISLNVCPNGQPPGSDKLATPVAEKPSLPER